MNDKKRLNSYEDLPLVLDVADIQRIMGISRASAYELVHTCLLYTSTENQKLQRNQTIDLPSFSTNRSKCSVFFDAFCDRDFQNVVDYQPSRQQDQNTHQNTRRSHK